MRRCGFTVIVFYVCLAVQLVGETSLISTVWNLKNVFVCWAVVEYTPHDPEFVGLNPFSFFFLFSSFISVFNRVSRGGVSGRVIYTILNGHHVLVPDDRYPCSSTNNQP